MPGEPPTGPGSGAGGRPAAGRGRRRGAGGISTRPTSACAARSTRPTRAMTRSCRPRASRRRGASARRARGLSLAAGVLADRRPFVLGRAGDPSRAGATRLRRARRRALRRRCCGGAPRSLGHVDRGRGRLASASVLWLDAPRRWAGTTSLLGAALLALGLLSHSGGGLIAAPRGGPDARRPPAARPADSLPRMPARRIRVAPAAALRDGFEAIRREAGVAGRRSRRRSRREAQRRRARRRAARAASTCRS